MEYEIEAGDYSFVFSIAASDFEHFCSGIQLFNYNIEIFRDGSYVDPHNSDIYKDLGISEEEFKTLLVEGTKRVIEELLNEITNKDGSTQIRSFVFFAVEDGCDTYKNRYGFSQHAIFKEISDDYLRIHSQGYDGGLMYVHTRELILRSNYDSNNVKYFSFDFHADTTLIETICNKIEANQETDFEDIDEIVDEVLEELLWK